MLTSLLVATALTVPSVHENADWVGEELDITSAPVTGLRCALKVQETGDLSLLTTCPLSEAQYGIVAYSVMEEVIIHLDEKSVARYELESAYGGGSIDAFGEVTAVDPETGILTLTVEEHLVTKKPKAGGFKGCL